jgi:general secretion pathway protein J
MRRQSGLSLLELLVVFVIISLVSTVLAQGFGFGLALFDRVQNREKVVVVQILSSRWFRHVNNSLVAQKEPGTSVIGNNKQFRAETINPLLAEPGVPTYIEWELDQGTLLYSEEGKQIRVSNQLPVGSQFQFRTADGDWINRWPRDKQSYLLPKAIRVVSVEETLMLATTKIRTRPNLLLEESRLDRR